DDIVKRTYAWEDRKRQFSPRQIGIAVDTLTRKGWVNTPSS
ncbi:MAG: Appr-1-p processing protein, partial [Candidatus Omnitrophica bacterium COP1]|nr:Appr-1-p processing protein [Candidatus Omnitrophica bacterium COP1]